MLLALRDKATGWFGWVVIILLIIPFMLWGITEYVGGGSAQFVAKVNGEKISFEEFKDRVRQHEYQSRQTLTSEARNRLKLAVLEAMVTEEMITQAMVDEGFELSDEQILRLIQAAPDFRDGNKFQPAAFNQFLQNQELTLESFNKLHRTQTLKRRFDFGVLGTEFASDNEVKTVLKNRNRKISLVYSILTAKDSLGDLKITDEMQKKFYNNNKKLYMTEEKAKIAYLELPYKDIFDKITVKEEDVKNYYETNKLLYKTAPIIKAAHIFFAVKKGAKAGAEAIAKKKADETYAKLKKGEKFDDLLKKVSEDKVSPDGDLGVIDPKTNKEFYKPLSKLGTGQYTAPIRSKHGYHILKSTLSKPGTVIAYEDIKEKLKTNYKKIIADKKYAKISESLYDLTDDNSETLDVAADKLKLEIKISDWFTRKGGNSGVIAEKKIVTVAFTGDVFADGVASESYNSKPIKLQKSKKDFLSQRYIILRLHKHKNRAVLAYEEIKEKVKTDLIEKLSREKAAKEGRLLYAELEKSGDLEAVAKSAKVNLVSVKELSRQGDKKYSATLVQAAFKTGIPHDKKPLNGQIQLANGDYIVYQVLSSKPDTDDAQNNKQLAKLFKAYHSDLLARNMQIVILDYLREKADIIMNTKQATRKPQKK